MLVDDQTVAGMCEDEHRCHRGAILRIAAMDLQPHSGVIRRFKNSDSSQQKLALDLPGALRGRSCLAELIPLHVWSVR